MVVMLPEPFRGMGARRNPKEWETQQSGHAQGLGPEIKKWKHTNAQELSKTFQHNATCKLIPGFVGEWRNVYFFYYRPSWWWRCSTPSEGWKSADPTIGPQPKPRVLKMARRRGSNVGQSGKRWVRSCSWRTQVLQEEFYSAFSA